MEAMIIYLIIGFFSSIFGLVFIVRLFQPAVGSASGYSLINSKIVFITITTLLWLPIVIGYMLAKSVGKDFINSKVPMDNRSDYQIYQDIISEIKRNSFNKEGIVS